MALVLRDMDLDPKRYNPRSFSHQVSNLKNELVDEETYAARVGSEETGTHHERLLAEAYSTYQRRLRQANALDFDDLIMTTVNILQAFPATNAVVHVHSTYATALACLGGAEQAGGTGADDDGVKKWDRWHCVRMRGAQKDPDCAAIACCRALAKGADGCVPHGVFLLVTNRQPWLFFAVMYQ